MDLLGLWGKKKVSATSVCFSLFASFDFSLCGCSAKTLDLYLKERGRYKYLLKEICHSFTYKSKKVKIMGN